MDNTISIPVIILTLGFFSFLAFAQDSSISTNDALADSELGYDRTLHDLGLGKRVYVAQFKRLPVYDFGLGKRSHSYNFGLGKRSGLRGSEDFEEYDDYPFSDDDDQMPELDLYHDDNMQLVDKRQQLYNFGLGKRLHRYDFGLGKRGGGHRYDFGLGKRSQPLPGQNQLYNFGLGKRNRLYSFGLGKRPFNQGPVPSRFNFGLGKRSEDGDASKNVIAKREVHEDKSAGTLAIGHGRDESVSMGSQSEKFDHTVEPESHEVMGHSDKNRLAKRSPGKFSSGSGKSSNAGFSRQFRKPMYNFGLGKRTSTAEKLKMLNN